MARKISGFDSHQGLISIIEKHPVDWEGTSCDVRKNAKQGILSLLIQSSMVSPPLFHFQSIPKNIAGKCHRITVPKRIGSDSVASRDPGTVFEPSTEKCAVQDKARILYD